MSAFDPKTARLIRTVLDSDRATLTARLLRAPGGPAVAFEGIAELRNRSNLWRMETAAARGLDRFSCATAASIYGAALDRLEAALVAASDSLMEAPLAA